MRRNKKFGGVILTAIIISAISFMHSSCSVRYAFADVNIPDSIKTVQVYFIENRAPYINPQLSQSLTDALRLKIVSQTRLTQVSNDNADYNIRGTITNYSVSTSGVTQNEAASNRLTVTVSMELTDRTGQPVQKQGAVSVTRTFEFSANLSLQQAEAQLNDEIIRNLTDEIFNRIFSTW